MIEASKLSGVFLKDIQRQVGLDTADCDGVWGPKTAAAVDAFDGPIAFAIAMPDISGNNKDISQAWMAARPEPIVGIKVSEGGDWTYAQAATFAQYAANEGKRIIYYHFACPDAKAQDACRERDWFLSCVAKLPAAVALSLDLETRGDANPATAAKEPMTGDALAEWADDFISPMLADGKRVLLYTGLAYFNNYLRGKMHADVDLWIAAYGRSLSNPPDANFSIWQYSGAPLDLSYIRALYAQKLLA